jgi:DnaK suppressor protein
MHRSSPPVNFDYRQLSALESVGAIRRFPYAATGRGALPVQYSMKGVSMSQFAAAKDRLEAQLAELTQRQARIADALSEPLNADLTEQAVEMEDDAGLGAEAAVVAKEIASIKRALGRIEDGIYGECVRCGAEITPARLEARPEAALCMDCAIKNEQGTSAT